MRSSRNEIDQSERPMSRSNDVYIDQPTGKHCQVRWKTHSRVNKRTPSKIVLLQVRAEARSVKLLAAKSAPPHDE